MPFSGSSADTTRAIKSVVRGLLPRSLANWRDARFYARYGEVELHVLEFLCSRDRDSVDIGANEGCYTNLMRRWSRRVIAFEPQPSLADSLSARFGDSVDVSRMALSDRIGSTVLKVPLVNGIAVNGCASIANSAHGHYAAFEDITVDTAPIDDVYRGDVGFMKIDVEGHEEAVLRGAARTLERAQPRLLVEIVDYLSPGGLERAKTFLSDFGYRGHFIYRGDLLDIDVFDVETMQSPDDAPDLTAPLSARERFPRFVYNFIFLPQGDDKTAQRIAARVATL